MQLSLKKAYPNVLSFNKNVHMEQHIKLLITKLYTNPDIRYNQQGK